MTEFLPSTHPFVGLDFLLTRPVLNQDCHLAAQIAALGGKTTSFPVIRLEPVSSPVEIHQALANLDQFDAVVFASPSGAHFLTEQCRPQQLAQLASAKIIAIGHATAIRLRQSGISVDASPQYPNSVSLAQLLIADKAHAATPERPYLIIRADRGSPTLAALLTESNIPHRKLVTYRSIDVDQAPPDLRSEIEQGRFDWLLLTSSMIAANTIRLFGQSLRSSRPALQLASLSPTISETLRQLGHRPTVEAPVAQFNSLLQAVAESIGRV